MAKNKKSPRYAPFVMFVVLPVLAIGISAFAVFKGVQNYTMTSLYFKIRTLKVEGIADVRYVDLMKDDILGTNIFELNTRKLAERIKRRFPTFYSIRVTRVLPSQLFIEAHERIPVAVVRRNQYYLFDAEGVVVSSFSLDALVNYPLLVGLENKLPNVRVGVAYDSGVLRPPLRLALMLRSNLPYVKITKIDAADPDDLSFYLGGDVQVRIGNRDFESRLRLLPAILKSIGPELGNVRYIDLRPKEPVVAYKKK